MPEIVKLSRGTHNEHETFTGEKGEVTLITAGGITDLPTGEVRVHDGFTAGGKILVAAAANPSTIDYTLNIHDGYNLALVGPINIGANGTINITGNLNII
jgi:hypothetical protein